jgi:hypothetical protein
VNAEALYTLTRRIVPAQDPRPVSARVTQGNY